MQAALLNKVLLRSLLGVSGVGSVSYVGSQMIDDKGFRRSAYFWWKVMPIYCHYRLVELMVQGKSEEEQARAFAPLHDKYAEPAVALIEELKGFYIKIGQIGSTRADFLPPQYYHRVARLQDDCPKVDFSVIRETLQASLGEQLEDMFEWIDETPLGAASIGQTHRAKMKDGRDVVVKVMFPDSERLFKGDMATIKAFCKLAQPEHLPMLDEVERQFQTEFDYRREGFNLDVVGRNIMPTWHKKVVIPRPILASKQVLVMDYVPGVKLVDGLKSHVARVAQLKGMTEEQLMAEIEEKEARGEVVHGATSEEIQRYSRFIWLGNVVKNAQIFFYNTGVRLIWGPQQPMATYVKRAALLDTEDMMRTLFMVHGHQIFVDGSFNSDPHPGNILLTPDNRIGLIDYGQVKHMPRHHRVEMAKLILALVKDDREEIVHQYKAMGFKTKTMNPDVIYAHCGVFFNIDDLQSLGGTNVQSYLEKLQKIDPLVSTADDYLMASRAAMLLRGLGYALKYRIKVANMWEPYAAQILAEEASISNSKDADELAAIAAREQQHRDHVKLCATEPVDRIIYFDK